MASAQFHIYWKFYDRFSKKLLNLLKIVWFKMSNKMHIADKCIQMIKNKININHIQLPCFTTNHIPSVCILLVCLIIYLLKTVDCAFIPILEEDHS